jgi:hypothetical protein
MSRGPRTAAVVAMLVVATVVLWWVVFPGDRGAAPTADPQMYASLISARDWAAAAVGLALLAAAGGYARGVTVALAGVALPAFALFCVGSATTDVAGANTWVIGALSFTPVLAAGTVAAAALGRIARRRTERQTADRS